MLQSDIRTTREKTLKMTLFLSNDLQPRWDIPQEVNLFSDMLHIFKSVNLSIICLPQHKVEFPVEAAALFRWQLCSVFWRICQVRCEYSEVKTSRQMGSYQPVKLDWGWKIRNTCHFLNVFEVHWRQIYFSSTTVKPLKFTVGHIHHFASQWDNNFWLKTRG